ILSMLPHRTSVHQKNRCFIRILGGDESSFLKVAPHLVGICDVHLAPVGAHVKLHKRTIISSTHARNPDRGLNRPSYLPTSGNRDRGRGIPSSGSTSWLSGGPDHPRPRDRRAARDCPVHSQQTSQRAVVSRRRRSRIHLR